MTPPEPGHADSTPSVPATTVFADALDWEAARALDLERAARRAWQVAGAAVLLTLLSWTALVLLLPLKQTIPFVIRVDSNAAVRILYAQKEEKIAREIADELGTQTVTTQALNQRQGGFRPSSQAHDTTTTSETRRLLLLPQEVKTIGPDKAILLAENLPPILARKLVYYRDRGFKRRLRPPAPVPVIDIPRHAVRGATAPALRLNYETFAVPKDRSLASPEVQDLATQWLQSAHAQAPPD